MPKDYAEEIKLQQHNGRVQMALDASKAMVEYSKLAIQGSFLLNGAGAVAIVTARAEPFYTAGMLFAIGAAISAASGGIAYLTQWKIYSFWYQSLNADGTCPDKESYWVHAGRIACAVLFAVSLGLFATGLLFLNAKINP